jgi:branched-chain amino acid transport system substrate-binding protein
VQANNLDQFREGQVQPIVWPPDMKTGSVIYPYADARKK